MLHQEIEGFFLSEDALGVVLVQVRTRGEERSPGLIPKSHVEPSAAEEGEGINPYQRGPRGGGGGLNPQASEGQSCSPGEPDLLPPS